MSEYATKQRRLILDALQKHPDDALTARQIAQMIPEGAVSVSAVYRNLATLEAEGKLQRLPKSGSRTAHYRSTDAGGCRRHLHLSCSECGRTFHMSVADTEAIIERAEKDDGFRVDSASTVLYGVCGDCRKKIK